jgi:hypothetical protein
LNVHALEEGLNECPEEGREIITESHVLSNVAQNNFPGEWTSQLSTTHPIKNSLWKVRLSSK